METLGRKVRNLTGKPHDSSAAKSYLLCGLFYLIEENDSALLGKKGKGEGWE